MKLLSKLLAAAVLASTALASPVASPIEDVEASLESPQLERRQGTGAVTSAAGLKFYQSNFATGTSGYANPGTYTCFSGPASKFPAISNWISFNKMYALLKSVALIPIGDTQAQAQDIYNGIVSISQAAKVDARVILAVIVLESTGNVHVKCTYNGVENCGLMQSHNGSSFNASIPAMSITRMIRDGTQGTPPPVNGAGLVQYFNDAPNTYVTTNGNLWNVLRGYNSGKINATNLSLGEGATPSYVSDIANYLLGWQGYGNDSSTQKCNFTQY